MLICGKQSQQLFLEKFVSDLNMQVELRCVSIQTDGIEKEDDEESEESEEVEEVEDSDECDESDESEEIEVKEQTQDDLQWKDIEETHREQVDAVQENESVVEIANPNLETAKETESNDQPVEAKHFTNVSHDQKKEHAIIDIAQLKKLSCRRILSGKKRLLLIVSSGADLANCRRVDFFLRKR